MFKARKAYKAKVAELEAMNPVPYDELAQVHMDETARSARKARIGFGIVLVGVALQLVGAILRILSL